MRPSLVFAASVLTALLAACPAALVGAATVDIQGGIGEGENQSNYADLQLVGDAVAEAQRNDGLGGAAEWDPRRGLDRPAKLANAVNNLLELSRRLDDRRLTLIRMARTQMQLRGEIDIGLAALAERPRWLRWLIGPDPKWLHDTEVKLKTAAPPLEEMRSIRDTAPSPRLRELLTWQIDCLSKLQSEQQEELDRFVSSFSFGRFLRRVAERI